MIRRRDTGGRLLHRAAAVVLVVLVAVAAAGVGYLETRAARTSTRVSRPVARIGALARATAAPATPSDPAPTGAPPRRLGAVLTPLLAAKDLGPDVHADVVDVATGRTLFTHDATTPGAPASTAKVLTAAALLSVRAPTYRIATHVVAGASPGTVVLVGGGDPTLTTARDPAEAAYPGAARISDLAAQVTRADPARITRVVVDDSVFSGPTTSPAWDRGDVPSSYGAAITGVLADGGRNTPSAVIRSTDSDLAAGRALATDLHAPHASVVRGTAAAHARTLATVRSPAISVLIEQMLQPSDNVIAEALARQVALATGHPASFLGSAAAIRAVLASRLGIRIGDGMVDGSGLAARDRVPAAALARLFALIAGGRHPQLTSVLAGLPVAAWSGTLATRFVGTAGAGVVRAKTGTLTGVSSLAGVVHDESGRLLAFAFLADHTHDDLATADSAESGLDVVVSALARCGC